MRRVGIWIGMRLGFVEEPPLLLVVTAKTDGQRGERERERERSSHSRKKTKKKKTENEGVHFGGLLRNNCVEFSKVFALLLFLFQFAICRRGELEICVIWRIRLSYIC